MRLSRAVWLGVKYSLAALGFVLWIALWFDRGLWLGVSQLVLCGLIIRHELIRRRTTGRW